VVASEGGFSVLELARSNRPEISPFAKGRAFRAAVATMICGLLLQAEGLLLVSSVFSSPSNPFLLHLIPSFAPYILVFA
jgi:hypothetical protein